MFKAVEGVYKKGIIHLSQFIDIGDETRVLIVFADSFGNSEKIADSTVVMPSGSSEELRLGDMDMTIGTKEKYLRELSGPVSEGESSTSAFFSSKPIDIGYTDAHMLNSIIVDSKK